MRTSPSRAWPATSSCWATLPGKSAGWKAGGSGWKTAQGNLPTIPFWLGEAPGRTWELSDEITQLREGIDRLLDNPQRAEAWLVSEAGVSPEVARQLVAYLVEGKRVLGVVPTAGKVVAERFFDESGGMQLVIHAPFGAAINRAWGMALRKRICRTFDFELQASATDDGLNFSLGPSMGFPVGDVFNYLSPNTVEEVLTHGGVPGPPVRNPLALERFPLPGLAAALRRQEGAGPIAADALRRPAGRRVPGPGSVPGQRRPARGHRAARIIPWCSRPPAIASPRP